MNVDPRLKNIINYIIEFADSDLEESRLPQNDILAGKMIGYASCLKIIKDEIDEDDWAKYGLDFDIDKKYM